MRQGIADDEPSRKVPESPTNSAVPPAGPARSGKNAQEGGRNWLTEPRTAVLVVLGGVVLVGGGRRLAQAWKARKIVARLEEPDVSPEEIWDAAGYGRSGLHQLFRLFGESESASPHRLAAGRALARLWAADELVAEEEQALVRRGYEVNWRARRRYPRGLGVEIPVVVTFGLPFLARGTAGVTPENLEWSHMVTGAGRAGLEEFSTWIPGPRRLEFSLFPADFETSGPHRLALRTRVRTVGLTDSWQIELPQIPFQFELDPRLEVDALLALPDETRGDALARSLRLVAPNPEAEQTPRFLALGDQMAIRNPPRIVAEAPLPNDLAHRIALEFEGYEGQLAAGRIVLGGQGVRPRETAEQAPSQSFEIGPIPSVPDTLAERPGRRRIRAMLTADPALGWTDPDIRSIWPGTLVTNWVEVEIVRR